MWFCTMSRSAPALLVVVAAALDADRLGDGDLDVVDVGGHQGRSNRVLAKRRTMRFCTVSFPR